jgi:hypothetical protein
LALLLLFLLMVMLVAVAVAAHLLAAATALKVGALPLPTVVGGAAFLAHEVMKATEAIGGNDAVS